MLAAAASLGGGAATQMAGGMMGGSGSANKDLQTNQQHQSLVDDPEIWGSQTY